VVNGPWNASEPSFHAADDKGAAAWAGLRDNHRELGRVRQITGLVDFDGDGCSSEWRQRREKKNGEDSG